MMGNILVLGGTREAVIYAEQLVASMGSVTNDQVIYSLAGRTEEPNLPKGCTIRLGGFRQDNTDTITGFVQYANAHQISVCFDATHPFAQRISASAKRACSDLSIPYIALNRPEWTKNPNDNWQLFSDTQSLIEYLDHHHDTVLFTLGQRGLKIFQGLRKCRGIFRMIHASQEAQYLVDDNRTGTNRHHILTARPPYGFDFEATIINKYNISALVTRPSGGERPFKLDAYAKHGLPVLILNDNVTQNTTATPPQALLEDIISAWCNHNETKK